MTIRRIEKYDIGKYKCIVENDAGSDKKEFDVDVVIKPSVKVGFRSCFSLVEPSYWSRLPIGRASLLAEPSYWSSFLLVEPSYWSSLPIGRGFLLANQRYDKV